MSPRVMDHGVKEHHSGSSGSGKISPLHTSNGTMSYTSEPAKVQSAAFCNSDHGKPEKPKGCENGKSKLKRNGSSGVISTGSPVEYKPLTERIADRISGNDHWFSLEFFPPRTANGVANLMNKFERLSDGQPLFCDITWHPAGDPMSDKPTSSMMIAHTMLAYVGVESMLHMTCCGLTREQLKTALVKAQQFGIRNILALRGDPPAGKVWSKTEDGFEYATDFVRYIREEFGSYFCIGVAGYPVGHPDCTGGYEEDLRHLKEKVDAGADFIITQMFFTSEEYLKFEEDARQLGITCPIMPGVMPIQAYESLRNITKLSQLDIPEYIMQTIEPIKDNTDAIRNFGISYAVDLCRPLLQSGKVHGLHFYTLNRDVASIEICKQLGLWKAEVVRPLPWKATAHPNRCKEEVRPIFWSVQYRSYVHRTSDWDEYPNGRWGNSSMAAFGDYNHHLFYVRPTESAAEEHRKMLGGDLTCEADVWNIFTAYVAQAENKHGVKVRRIPWSEEEMREETRFILDELINLNQLGFLTTNSQPNCDGVDSTDSAYGWGGAGGFIYQKAYLEFFMPTKRIPMLLEVLADNPHVNYHILDTTDSVQYTNCDSARPMAVTWGVFPGREICQPTVVDPVAFQFWKDEAFSLWLSMWAALHSPGSTSRKVLHHIYHNYSLVNLVDNNYPRPNSLFGICRKLTNLERLRRLDYDPNVEPTDLKSCTCDASVAR